MSFFGTTQKRPFVEAPPPPASNWLFTALGDDVGSIVENTDSEFEMISRGTKDVDDGQFAYKVISAGNDIQVIAKIPASWTGTPENFTSFGVQIRAALTGQPILMQCVWPNIGTVRAKHRDTANGTVNASILGIADESLARWVGITFETASNQGKFWESSDGVDWFQFGPEVNVTLPEVNVGPYAVSHDPFNTVSATLTNVTATTTITIAEAAPPAPPGERTGIIQTNLFDSNTFDAYGTYQNDNGSYDTYLAGPGNNALHKRSSGGTWGTPATDMTRVDINSEEGASFSPSNDFLRIRLRYDQSYFDINGSGSGPNKPRNNFRWSPGGSGGRLEDGALHWLSFVYYFPSDYEADSSSLGNQEILLQFHTSSGGQGHGALQLGGQGIEQGRLNIILQQSDTTDRPGGNNETIQAHIQIDAIKGEFMTFMYRYKINPFSVQTTINSGMGRWPQIGEVYNGNQGIYEVWASVPAGASWTSDTLGTVTNSTGSIKMMQVCQILNGPVGLVPSWKNGVVNANSQFHAFSIYKGRWMNHVAFSSRPSIPHSHSKKNGPIDVYLGHIRLGDDSSDYKSMHPSQEDQP